MSLSQNLSESQGGAEFVSRGRRLLSWIPPAKLDFVGLSRNPSPSAMALLRANPKQVYWGHLSGNPSAEAAEMLASSIEKVCWYELSRNPGHKAVELLMHNEAKVDWVGVRENPSPGAAWMISSRLERIYGILSETFQQADQQKQWLDFFLTEADWALMSLDPRPEVAAALAANPEKVHWKNMSRNPSPTALAMLKENKARISWGDMRRNPSPEAQEFWMANYPVLPSWTRGHDLNIRSEDPMPPIPIMEPVPLGVVESIRAHLATGGHNPSIMAALWRRLSEYPEIFEALEAAPSAKRARTEGGL